MSHDQRFRDSNKGMTLEGMTLGCHLHKGADNWDPSCPQCHEFARGIIKGLAESRDELKDSNRFLEAERVALQARVSELVDPRNAYGLSLAVEQEKVKALLGVVKEAAALLEDGYKVDATADVLAFNARVNAWLTHPTVVAALREVKG